MKKYTWAIIGALLIGLFIQPIQAEKMGIPEVVILSTTDEMKEGYAVMEKRSGSPELEEVINNSFVKQSIELYQETLNVMNLKKQPFYLSFKKDSGCYGRIGFYLKENDVLIDKTSSSYIELGEHELIPVPGRLQSITQIFPHEMGHILLALTSQKFREPKSNSLVMHYSNVITEYSTAFNEGFAEHFEIIARKYEENIEIKNKISEDMVDKEKKIKHVLARAERDFVFPLRLDYYRAIVPFWFQQAEGLKRERLPVSGECIYANSYKVFKNPEKTLLLRNMGLKQDMKKIRSLQQSLATESVISRFFILLEQGREDPLADYYLKIIKVFDQYIGKEESSPLIEFVNGYSNEYPHKKEFLLQIFKEATGYEFTQAIAPEIWLVHKGNHIITPLDQFGSIRFPLYIFNLNTAETEDLLKLGIKPEEVKTIIRYRDEKRYFVNIGELKAIQGIGSETISIFEKAFFEEGEQEELNQLIDEAIQSVSFSMMPLILASLKHIFVRTIILFIVFFITYYLFVLRKRKSFIKPAIKQFIKFILYMLLGLISALTSVTMIIDNKSVHPVVMFAIIVVIMEGVKLLLLHRDESKIRDSLMSTLMMSGVFIYSLF